MIIGYAKVSTDEQSLDTQISALKAAGAEKVFQEKISGARADRPQLTMMLASLEAGDVVVITCLDRLARSTRDLLNILAHVGEQGAVFRSLAEPWANTSTPYGELMITVLKGLATFERHLLAVRSNEGLIRARAQGRRLGRKPKLTTHQRAEALAALANGSETAADLARRFSVNRSTITRLRP